MKRALRILTLVACGASCDPPEEATYPVPATRIDVHPQTRVIVSQGPELASVDRTQGQNSAAVDIVVTTARKLDRPTEIVGVIDAHEPSGRQDAAFALIRERAAAMGADAVVGVEFHHGEEHGEPTHLSGLAVRYIDSIR